MSQFEFEIPPDRKSVVRAEALDILLPALGSAGDVHPMIELGIALKKRGHHATIITNALFEHQVRNAVLEYVELGTIREAEVIFADPRLLHPTKCYECLAELVVLPYISPLYEIIRERQRPNTVVAASGLCFGARIAQEKLGVHLATVHLQPAMLRSLSDRGPKGRAVKDLHIKRLIMSTFFWLLDKLRCDPLLAPSINSFRAGLGLAPVSRILKDYFHSPEVVIGAFPEWFAPVQPDWPENTHLTGFILHDDGAKRHLPDEVNDFLEDGPPPVVFTPGSSAATLTDFFRESVAACRIGGFRAMLVTNFPEQLPSDLPASVRAFSYLPFSQVLPRCSALVYPGGIGTLAQAVKAGIPHLVVPHVNDQPDNALRIERLGLGSRISPRHYKASRVARELDKLLSSPEVGVQCSTYAATIDPTAALNRTCDLIVNLGEKGGKKSELESNALHGLEIQSA